MTGVERIGSGRKIDSRLGAESPDMASNTEYETGDVVQTPDGRGVVAAILTDDFQFPQNGEDEYADVDAAPEKPAYVVGLETGGSAVYRASSLVSTTFDEDDLPEAEGEAITDQVNEEVNALDDLPQGWDRQSVLEYWSSVGGSWSECVEDLTDEFEEERAEEHCSAMKDEVLRTQRWRNRF